MTTRLTRTPGLIAALVMMLATPVLAQKPAQGPVPAASPAVECTLTEIVASNEKDPAKQGVDPKLARYKGKLTRGPFAAWNTFKLIGEQRVSADKDRPVVVKLAPGGKLTLLFKDIVAASKRPRLRVGMDMDDRGGKRILSTVVVLDSGDAMPIAGEAHGEGTYILVPSCALK